MKPGRGKAKGGSFERLICDELSRWIDPKGSDSHFWRSSMSGGRSTVRGKVGKLTKSQVGDISALTPMGYPITHHLMIECKHLKSLKLTSALISGTGLMAEFWQKLETDARVHDKLPVLIGRQNGFPIIALMHATTAALFNADPATVLGFLCSVSRKDVAVYRFHDLMVRPFKMEKFK